MVFGIKIHFIAIFFLKNLAVSKIICTFAPEFGKAINFSRQKDGKGDHGGGAWKSSCQIKKISQIQNPAAKVRKINCFTKFLDKKLLIIKKGVKYD